jgi:hypothetical protein
MRITTANKDGSTLVVTIVVVATLLALLGVAVDYTTQISRNTQRSRKTALAMEIADGHLEALFTSWRNIYRTSWTTISNNSGGTDYSLAGTNYFYTAMYSPSPAPTPLPSMAPSGTPPIIPLPSSSLFPTSNYTVTQYRIQAVDPMITLDASENSLVEGSSQKGTGGYVALSRASPPPAAYGPNMWQYSFYYLAAVDVSVPALTGSVTAKVRRVFEKKFDQPWTYAMFYMDDLELQPSRAMTITGPIHTNSGLYIGTSNFTASGIIEYGSDYVNGYSPKDGKHSGTPTAPNFAKSDSSLALSDCPPSQVSPFLPFGWNLNINGGTGNGNDDSYHEIIETTVTGQTDPLKYVRYYNQPGYQVVIAANTSAGANGTYTVTSVPTPTSSNPSPTPIAVTGNTLTNLVGNNGNGSSSTVFNQGRALYDAREGGAVKVTDVDIAKLITNLGSLGNWTGVLYLADKGAVVYNTNGTAKNTPTPTPATVAIPSPSGTQYTTTKRAFRLINAASVPTTTGLTIVSENPVYIQGDFNTGGTPPSDSGTYTSPTVNGYVQVVGGHNTTHKPPCAIIADAITVLSPGWSDANSAGGIASRVATANVTINAALVTGNIPSGVSGGNYSGGGENFIRLLEDWSSRTFCYYGSMTQLFRSNQAVGLWNGDGTVYVSPSLDKWYYDDGLFSSVSPPGNLQVAAYLQQQRWYQVY